MAGRRIGIILILFCLCFCLMPYGVCAVSTADAAEPVSPERECTLRISCICDGTVLADVSVQLYRIAEVSPEAYYTPVPGFRTAGLVLNGIQSSGEWDMIRSTLEAHILANAVEADFASVTDGAGLVSFDALEPGLYLAVPGRGEQNGMRYSFRSALIALPGLDAEGFWQYHADVIPKPEVTPLPEPDEPPVEKQYRILKLWKDETGRAERPASIEVEIFRSGTSWRTVTLSEEDHWTYTWTDVESDAGYMAVERNIPEGYTVTVEERAGTFILTNVFRPEDPGTTPPADAPQTGDTSHIILYAGLMYGFGAGLILLGMIGKRKRT